MQDKPIILVVDDHPQNIELLKAHLVSEGYDVVAAGNGEEALGLAQKLPDLILLDIIMPKMSGFEVLEKLRAGEKTQLIPVVMITALRETQDKVKAIEAGCDDFISKPFDKNELLARVRSLLRIKRLQDEVRGNYDKLKDLEALKDNLAHMIIHDFNNPLMVISGNLQLVKLSCENLSAAQKNYVEQALVACRYLQRMAKDLLDVNKMEEGKTRLHLEKFNLGVLVKDAVGQMKIIAFWEKKELSCEMAENIPEIVMDKELVERVVVNLVSNAIKFTHEGGRIVVSLAYDHQGNSVYLCVKDDGAGIAPQYLERLFDKFMQVESKEAKHGYGLGLTFCKMAVEAHGGEIKVESQEGKGSTFIVRLPVIR
jgi:signal transduction histidine kinase